MVMHVELQATCSALGYLEGEKYVKEPDCLETVKDLIRFLKHEDDTLDIRRQLGHAQILQNDLIPIMKEYHEDRNLFETVLRLSVNLTQPTVLCFGNKLPDDKTMRNYALEIDSHLQSYKEVFADEELFTVLSTKIGSILKLDWEHRQEEDKLLLERLLILIRNVLHIPPNPDLEQRTDDDASIHDQILWVMHISGLEDMLIYIASSDEERQLCMHMLEIISLMFREQTPEILASAGMQRSKSEKEKDERELERVRLKEQRERKMNMLKLNTRHSRFGGTYVVVNMKSISDKDMIYHKSQGDIENLSLDFNKKYHKKAKHLAPIKDTEVHRRSTLSIRLCLKEFIVQFLENCYNPLMFAVKDNLVREKTQDHDETYYLWAMRFFMEFCRLHSKRVDLVSETLSITTFHYIYNNLLTYYEMIMSEKKEAVTWSKRVHLALKAYQELLLTLDMMDRSKNPQLMESSKVIKSNIFYMMEFRDIFVTLLKRFNQTKQSRSYLKDLVESTHLFLRMLDQLSRQTHLVVQQKKKIKKKKNNKKTKNQTNEPSEQELEESWDQISDELSALIQGHSEIPTDITPFDAASEVDDDQQRAAAMINIQDALRGHRTGEGVALLRAAREVWPERDDFGKSDITPEDEFMALREIFMTNIPRPNSQVEASVGLEEEEIENEVEEEEIESVCTSEQSFDFKTFLHNFAKGDILKSYALLLADFEKNSIHTNHCVLKMLHRIAVDLGYPAMIFQASIFRVFQKVLLGPYAKMKHYQELARFATYIIRKFTEIAEANKKIFMEMLFWKGKKESLELTDGYGSFSSKSKSTWTEDQEEELLHLFEMFRDSEDPEKDTVDLIMERFTDPTKRRGQIICELKRLNLISSAKDLKKKKTTISSKTWTEEEEFELADLYETHKNSADPVGNILAELSHKRSKNKIIEKLLSSGLVQDKSELYKKRRGKKKGSDDENDDVDDDDGDGYDEGDGFIVKGDDDSDKSDKDGDDGDDDVPSSDDNSDNDDDVSGQITPTSSAADCIRNVVGKGYRGPIGWIQTKLRRAADDREKDGVFVPIPIVPLSDENETAMEDSVFTDFLQMIGLSPPSNEQEAFWRIPTDLSVTDLRNVADGLVLDESGEPVTAEKIKIKTIKKTKAKKSRNDSKNRKKNDQKRKADERKEKESKKKKSEERRKMLQTLLKKRKEGKRKRRDSDSPDRAEKHPRLSPMDDENTSTVVESGNKEIKSASKKKNKKSSKLKRVIDSDDESLSALGNENTPTVVESENEEIKSASKKKNKKSSKLKRVIDSDDESLSLLDDVVENGNKEIKSASKKKNKKSSKLMRLVDSDDESLSPLDDVVENGNKEIKSASMKKKIKSSKLKRVIDSDDESLSLLDDVVENGNTDIKSASKKKNKKSSKLKRVIDSDDESLSPMDDENTPTVVENGNADIKSASKRKNKKSSKSKRLADSDDERQSSSAENEDKIPDSEMITSQTLTVDTEPKKKKTASLKRLIESDSDSDDDRLVVDEDDEECRKPQSKRPKLFNSDDSDDEGEGHDKNKSESEGLSQGESEGHTQDKSESEGLSQDHSDSEGHAQDKSDSEGHTQDKSDSEGHDNDKSDSEGHTQDKSDSEGRDNDKSDSEGHTQDKSDSEGHDNDKSDSEGHTQDKSDSEGHAQDKSDTEGHTQDKSESEGLSQGQSDSEGHAQDKSDSEGHAQDKSDVEGHDGSQSDVEDHTQDKSDSEGHDGGQSDSEGHTQDKSDCEGQAQSETARDQGQGQETFPATMLSQLRDDSDSDVDDHIPLRKMLNRKCIESDDDDD